ncbi:MAG: translation initiation factor IF-2, partial [Nanoarchaeota archaeon]|nr:translation initiation factor IF-2 [Nanoarchaeota archaeon]
GGLKEPIVTKVKGLFKVENKKLENASKAEAAAYVKISAINIEDVIAGMPLIVSNKKDLEEKKKAIQKEVTQVLIETDNEGVIVKADSLGSLEALIGLLKENNILIKKASIGDISKKDITEASAERNKLHKAVLGFNVKSVSEAKDVRIINKNIIYKIVEDYKKWEETENKKTEAKALEELPRPFNARLLTGCIFRQSNPAVVGVEVLNGMIKIDSKVMNESGKPLGEIKTIQLDGENKKESKKGEQIAIALPKVTIGRNLFENEIILSDFTEEEFRKLREMKEYLNEDEINLLKLIATIKRKQDKLWGI